LRLNKPPTPRPSGSSRHLAENRDRHGEGIVLGNLGAALLQVQRFEEAITACQDAAAILLETGDRHAEGIALANLKKEETAQLA
jgi:hypothetical protein